MGIEWEGLPSSTAEEAPFKRNSERSPPSTYIGILDYFQKTSKFAPKTDTLEVLVVKTMETFNPPTLISPK